MQQSIQNLVEDFVSQVVNVAEAYVAAALKKGGVVSAGKGAAKAAKLPKAAKAKTAGGRASYKLSAEGAKKRKLQGQYLGALRSLKGSNRNRVRALAASKGVAAAVKLAMSLRK